MTILGSTFSLEDSTRAGRGPAGRRLLPPPVRKVTQERNSEGDGESPTKGCVGERYTESSDLQGVNERGVESVESVPGVPCQPGGLGCVAGGVSQAAGTMGRTSSSPSLSMPWRSRGVPESIRSSWQIC